MIVGTAGHIDHGKTALVRALTGVDTDRLPEEQRRGITIELGFAPLRLSDDTVLGMVDVPGHEAFVRTMLAGATGVDLAMLVIAADEGVMPQTREHLAILSLLGVRGGVVALSKCDLVDEEWLALVREEVRGTVAGTVLHDAPVISTSAATGAGIDALHRALAAAAAGLPARDAGDLFRMPVDRAFTVRGTGTVATGTVWSGAIDRESLVRLLPGGVAARVRGIQVHGADVDRAEAGSRAALALAGVDLGAVGRGVTLVSDPAWLPTRRLRATVSLLPGAAAALRPRTAVRFHLGTSEVGARVVAEGGALVAGRRAPARVVLDAAIIARAGDRFILRAGTPHGTIGGGVVIDPLPPGRRPRPLAAGDGAPPGDRLRALVAEGGRDGIPSSTLPVRLGIHPDGASRLVHADSSLVVAGGRVFEARSVEELAQEMVEAVASHHERSPLEPGAPLQTVRAGRRGAPELVELALGEAIRRGLLGATDGLLRQVGWSPRLADGDRRTLEALREALHEAGREPPSTQELAERHGDRVGALLRLLEREGAVVPVEPNRYFDREVLDQTVVLLRARMRPGREYTPAELRDMLGVSRKYLMPLLEFCDRRRITDRRSSGRVLVGT